MYYLRTLPAANAIQFTVKKVMEKKNNVEKKVQEVTNNSNDAKINESGDTNVINNDEENEGCLMCSG